MSTPIGPNVRRLIGHKMALIAIPPGSGEESFAIGLNVIADKERFTSIAREARIWVENAIVAVRTAPDNHFADDEEIAVEVLRRIELKSGRGTGEEALQ